MTAAPGARLGHYVILAPLGAGGMGEVWLAEDTTLKRRVALKVLPAGVATDPDRLARFQREAEAVAALSHPNIVTIHSIEQDGDIRFLTMERVEGQSLDQVIPRGGLPLGQVLEIGATLADALAASHEKGIVHRDLKPANIMLAGRERRVKVLDFGLAKLREEAAADGETTTAALSGEGRILGTVAYMSPEQAEGRPVDARSDLFSLGIVLYEMATGERPFKGETSISVLSAILRDTPKSVTDLRGDLPKEFARIVRQCLQKDPEERYQTAKDLRNQLRALKADLDSGELASTVSQAGLPQQRRRRSWRWLPWGVGAALLLIGGWMAAARWFALTGQPSNTVLTASTPRKLTTHGKVGVAAISPDAKFVVYSLVENGRQSLVMRQIETAIERTLVQPEEGRYHGVTFSRDGDYMYYVYRDKFTDKLAQQPSLYRVSTLGGDAKRICAGVSGPAALSPDGRQLAFVRVKTDGDNELMAVNADGGEPRSLTTAAELGSLDGGPGWSPDGRTIVAPVSGKDGGLWGLLEVPSSGGAAKPLGASEWGDIWQTAWFEDGRRIVMSAASQSSGWFYQLWSMSYPDGETSRFTNDPNNYMGVSVSRSPVSLITVQSDWSSRVWIAHGDSSSQFDKISTGEREGYSGVVWTPGGQVVCGSREWDLWTMEADGTHPRLLTADEHNNRHPIVSADGRYIFFDSWRRGNSGIWRMDIDGSNAKQLTSGALDLHPRVSPDGKWVYFRRLRGTSYKGAQWRVPPDGGTAAPVTDLISGVAAVSPDGALLAGWHADGPGSKIVIAVVRVDGGQAVKNLDWIPGTVAPTMRWTPDGRALTYVVTDGTVSNIYIQPLAGGPARPITDFKSEEIWAFDWSKDNKLILARGSRSQDVVLFDRIK